MGRSARHKYWTADDEDLHPGRAQFPEGPRPRDVPCPTCGAAIGRECTTRTGYGTTTHSPRCRPVGISNPSQDDRSRDYWDGERRKLETIEAQFDGLHAKLYPCSLRRNLSVVRGNCPRVQRRSRCRCRRDDRVAGCGGE
ncbi:zinc finger domain-containing protein [Burkholderia seminalis]